MAIIGDALAAELTAVGFVLEQTVVGRFITVYYFEDTPELEKYLSFDINWKL